MERFHLLEALESFIRRIVEKVPSVLWSWLVNGDDPMEKANRFGDEVVEQILEMLCRQGVCGFPGRNLAKEREANGFDLGNQRVESLRDRAASDERLRIENFVEDHEKNGIREMVKVVVFFFLFLLL
ncbi:LOW QUALITY PROTEIN: hypothetical protein PanWU01x14_040530 [Parasponia andersonii]|uniref:Uncharacterized protein n=1 Tax=Parasponia andersonii TaxID=3476 RepID=A0A2P5DR71_PARAD|nr:LOW QUALITY PROTEIN: hypothetical protein PanWU01x14_040530 [Parasponia andersonii]